MPTKHAAINRARQVAVAYYFYGVIIVNTGADPVAALKEARELSKGNRWPLFGAELLATLITFLGFLAFGIGLLPAIPVNSVAAAHIYHQLPATDCSANRRIIGQSRQIRGRCCERVNKNYREGSVMSHPFASIGRRYGVAVVAIAALLAVGCGSSESEDSSSMASSDIAVSDTETPGSSDTAEDPTASDSQDDEPEDGDAEAATGPAGATDLQNLAMGGRTLQEGTYGLELNGADLEVEIDASTAGLQLESLNPDTLAVTSDATYFAIGSVMGLVPAELAAGEMAGPPPTDQLVAFGTPDDVADHLDTVPGIAVVGEGERTFAGEPLFWWDIELDPDRPGGSTATCPRFVPRGSECVLVVAAEDWGGFVTEVDRLRLYWSPNLEIGGIAEAQREGFDDWMEPVNGLLDGISAAQV